ncbi:MAG TPA: hypothetical protein VFN80_03960 [Acidothermaceae bacterium]|nr:hypothetical protein [Acidothermaceae bacterium]
MRRVCRPGVWGPSTAGPGARDSGDIILGWLTKLVIGISLTGVVAFDGVSIGVAHVSTIDDANSAALAASHAWQDSHDMNRALQAAQQTAAQHGETVVDNSLSVDADGTAHVAVQREATTLIVRHIHALRSWIEITASGSGRSVSQ